MYKWRGSGIQQSNAGSCEGSSLEPLPRILTLTDEVLKIECVAMRAAAWTMKYNT